jgi:hypothetical protein
VRALREIRTRIARAKVKWPSGLTASSVADMVARHPVFPIAMKQTLSLRLAKGEMNQLKVLQRPEQMSSELGDRLLDAISTGEMPALCDVRTPEELRQIIELGKSRWHTIMVLVSSNEVLSTPLSDDLIRQISLFGQAAAEGIFAAARAMVATAVLGRSRTWTRARHLVLTVTRHETTLQPVEPLLLFFAECSRRNLAAEALDLLVDADLAERWAPLYEALRALAEGGRAQLDSLAPEMRAGTLAIFDWFSSASVSQAPDERVDMARSSRGKKRPPIKRRGAQNPGKPRQDTRHTR